MIMPIKIKGVVEKTVFLIRTDSVIGIIGMSA